MTCEVSTKAGTTLSGEKKVPFSMAVANVEQTGECSPEHLNMGTARMKLDKETDEEGKKRRVNMERSTAGTKKKSVDGSG